jgi:hypothetical protein
VSDQNLLIAIHDLNTSRYQLEVAIEMLAKIQVPEGVEILHKSIMEKITNAHKILVEERPKPVTGESI